MVIFILNPLVWALTASINFMIILLGGKERVKHPFVTEDKIKMMLKVGEQEGTIKKHEREIIHNVFELSYTKASDVMTPLENMVCIEESKTIDTALDLINESGHSRIPVYKQTFDNIIGMIYVKDFIKFSDHDRSRIQINQILRPILIVKAEREIHPLLKELQQKKMNISVVVDDDKKVIGLISVEDILEELVGEIFDEYDIETKIKHQNS